MAAEGYIPDSVLLLAHDVANNQDQYGFVFSSEVWDNTNIIMDNSVVETGGAVDGDMVLLAADTVGADVVVLPDVLGDGERSRQETNRAWSDWYWQFRDYEKMIVIQGETEVEWLRSAEEFVKFEPEWIAIPRIVETSEWERHARLRWAKMLYPSARCHLLGFSDFVAADLVAASDDYVVSIDSAVPLRYTGQNLLTDHIPPRGDWWETVELDADMISRCLQIDTYIQRLAE